MTTAIEQWCNGVYDEHLEELRKTQEAIKPKYQEEYEKYVLWCMNMGSVPSNFEKYFKVTDTIKYQLDTGDDE